MASTEDVDVYLDNNATTMMPPEVVDTFIRWMNRGNASAEYASAREARKMMQRFRQLLAVDGGFDLKGPQGYSIVFTSGGSEGNCHVVTAAARAFSTRTGKLPHVIVSAVEHQSLLTCCHQMFSDRMIRLTVLPVRTCTARRTGATGDTSDTRGASDSADTEDTGTVDPEELRGAIRANTCLISIIAANNETGALNNLRVLGQIAHESKIPFHTDAVQFFGRSKMRPVDLNLDAYTGSFHKLHGPPGVGFLALRNDFIEGYDLGALVCGPQNSGLRGGVENLPGIAGAFAAYKRAVAKRSDKNLRTRRLRDGIQTALARRFPTVHVNDYCEARPRISDEDPPHSPRATSAQGVRLARRLDDAAEKGTPVLVWIAPKSRTKILPNTLLFSVLRSERGGFCNRKARAALESAGIIVGICSGNGDTPSHVIEALDIPPELWRGILRISLSGDTTAKEAATFVNKFSEIAVSGKVLLD